MRKKRTSTFKLHSIPIISNNSKLRYISYSIPLASIVALLLVFGVAVTVDTSWFGFGNAYDSYALDSSDSIGNNSNDGIGENAGSGDMEGDGDVMLLAATSNIAMSLSTATGDGYGNTPTGVVTTAPGGGTAYRSHKIMVTGSNIMNYMLKISGPANLTPSSGATGTVVSGAGGKTGTEMSTSGENIWGYAWGENNDDVTDMHYNTMPSAGGDLDCNAPDVAAGYSVDCERKLVFGANFDTTASPGTYTAMVTLSLTSTPAEVAYSINYDANGGANAPAAQSKDSVADSETFTIASAGSMSKTGYEFLGWNTSSSATTADSKYAPGASVTLQKANPTLQLYAVWKSKNALWSNGTDSGALYMQDVPNVSGGFCKSSIPTGTTVKLKDKRDTTGNTEYTIVKLADGNCWMQENLRLKLTTAGLDSTNSDLTSNWNSSSTVKPAATLTGSGTTATGWSNQNAQALSIDFGNTTNGVYYNWCAATAGTCASATTTGAEAAGSICPKGWRLPSNSGNPSYSNLISKGSLSTGAQISAGIYKFPYAGGVVNTTLADQGTDGIYWSSTANGSVGAYSMLFDSSNIGPSAYYDRYLGFSVRCVARS